MTINKRKVHRYNSFASYKSTKFLRHKVDIFPFILYCNLLQKNNMKRLRFLIIGVSKCWRRFFSNMSTSNDIIEHYYQIRFLDNVSLRWRWLCENNWYFDINIIYNNIWVCNSSFGDRVSIYFDHQPMNYIICPFLYIKMKVGSVRMLWGNVIIFI